MRACAMMLLAALLLPCLAGQVKADEAGAFDELIDVLSMDDDIVDLYLMSEYGVSLDDCMPVTLDIADSYMYEDTYVIYTDTLTYDADYEVYAFELTLTIDPGCYVFIATSDDEALETEDEGWSDLDMAILDEEWVEIDYDNDFDDIPICAVTVLEPTVITVMITQGAMDVDSPTSFAIMVLEVVE